MLGCPFLGKVDAFVIPEETIRESDKGSPIQTFDQLQMILYLLSQRASEKMRKGRPSNHSFKLIFHNQILF